MRTAYKRDIRSLKAWVSRWQNGANGRTSWNIASGWCVKTLSVISVNLMGISESGGCSSPAVLLRTHQWAEYYFRDGIAGEAQVHIEQNVNPRWF